MFKLVSLVKICRGLGFEKKQCVTDIFKFELNLKRHSVFGLEHISELK